MSDDKELLISITVGILTGFLGGISASMCLISTETVTTTITVEAGWSQEESCQPKIAVVIKSDKNYPFPKQNPPLDVVVKAYLIGKADSTDTCAIKPSLRGTDYTVRIPLADNGTVPSLIFGQDIRFHMVIFSKPDFWEDVKSQLSEKGVLYKEVDEVINYIRERGETTDRERISWLVFKLFESRCYQYLKIYVYYIDPLTGIRKVAEKIIYPGQINGCKGIYDRFLKRRAEEGKP